MPTNYGTHIKTCRYHTLNLKAKSVQTQIPSTELLTLSYKVCVLCFCCYFFYQVRMKHMSVKGRLAKVLWSRNTYQALESLQQIQSRIKAHPKIMAKTFMCVVHIYSNLNLNELHKNVLENCNQNKSLDNHENQEISTLMINS